MATTTFVFVTPRRWPKKTDWAAKKRAEGKWRDVLALDGDDIEQALDEAPAIHFWFSEALGMHTAAVQTLEAWWDGFSSAYEPTLTPRMVLAGRANEAAALLRLLARDVGRALVRAASVDDGLAFVGSVMLSADPDASAAMLSKSLLVHDGASLRRLDSTSSLLILLPYEEQLLREADLVRITRLLNGHPEITGLATAGDGPRQPSTCSNQRRPSAASGFLGRERRARRPKRCDQVCLRSADRGMASDPVGLTRPAS
jgi:hypothetical protein